jgi:hypothetical protein
MTGTSEFWYTVMSPTPTTKRIVYIASPAGLVRDTGEQEYTTGVTVDVGLPGASTGHSVTACSSAPRKPLATTEGTFRFAYTYYDSTTGAESKASSVSILTIAAANNAQVTFPITFATAGHADTVRLYRSIEDGGTLYLSGSSTITPTKTGTGTTYHSGGDSTLGAVLPDVGQPPSNATLIAQWRERAWYSGVTYFDGENANSRVFHSRRNLPETVPPDYYIQVDDSEAVMKALVVMGESLYAVSQKGIYEAIGTTAESFRFDPTLSDVGTQSGKSVAVGPDGIFFVNYSGVYLFKYKAEKISEQIEWLFDDSGDTWNSVLSKGDIESSRGAYWHDKYWLSIGSRTLIYDPAMKRWHERTTAFTSLWTDVLENDLYVGVSYPKWYTVASLIDDGTQGKQGLYSPDFITKSEYIAGSKEGVAPGVEWVSKFKVYCDGYWTFYFYVDGTLAYTKTGTTYTSAVSRNTIYNFPSDIKGQTMYVRGVASGVSVQPNECRFYTMEIW